MALAADDYDAAMMAHCQRAIADEPAYWAQLWPSALALSRRLLERPELVAGRAVVEIGSGLGLASLAAAHAGAASVLATDREPRALAFAAQSAAGKLRHRSTQPRESWNSTIGTSERALCGSQVRVNIRPLAVFTQRSW